MSKRVYLDEKVGRSSRFNVEDFENHISELLNYCKIIKNQEEEEQTLMKNWVVVRLFSLLEFHLKAVFSDLIDDLNINPKRIVEDDSIAIDLNVLEHFKSEQYTKGRVIIYGAENFEKMNPSIIKTIMDRINRLDFYEWYGALFPKAEGTKALVHDLHKKRNDVTHNLVDIKDVSAAQLENNVRAFKNLVTHYRFFTVLNIGIFEQGWTTMKQLRYCESVSNMQSKEKWLQKFKETTDKFRSEYSDPVNEAICDDCGNKCEVPFKPREGRPVYCKKCYQKHRTR